VRKELNEQKKRSENNKDNMDFDQLPGCKESRESPGGRFSCLLPMLTLSGLEIPKKRPDGTQKSEEDYRMCKNSHYVSRHETGIVRFKMRAIGYTPGIRFNAQRRHFCGSATGCRERHSNLWERVCRSAKQRVPA
jgi:hypothetical protein